MPAGNHMIHIVSREYMIDQTLRLHLTTGRGRLFARTAVSRVPAHCVLYFPGFRLSTGSRERRALHQAKQLTGTLLPRNLHQRKKGGESETSQCSPGLGPYLLILRERTATSASRGDCRRRARVQLGRGAGGGHAAQSPTSTPSSRGAPTQIALDRPQKHAFRPG